MKTLTVFSIAASLAFASGCAKPDCIQQTLVTADVTGVWVGAAGRPSGTPTFEARFELEQRGPKVFGAFLAVGSATPTALSLPAGAVPIEGSVAGDVFRFTQSNGVITGEMTVSGDEMTGYVRGFPLSLRRVSSPPPASSKP